VCCSALQCVVVCCSVLQCPRSKRCAGSMCEEVLLVLSLNMLQHTATHCNTLQHAACTEQINFRGSLSRSLSQHAATRCNTLQHAATHCNTLQHTATHCRTLQDTAKTLPQTQTAAHCNTLQHTATHCNRSIGKSVSLSRSSLSLYGVATINRLLKSVGLFCKIQSLL